MHLLPSLQILVSDLYLLTVFALAISLISVVYTCILSEPDMILSRWFATWEMFLLYPSTPTVTHKRTGWFVNTVWKLFFECERCFAGQATLWLFLLLPQPYNILYHVYTVSAAIFLASTLKSIYKWQKNR